MCSKYVCAYCCRNILQTIEIDVIQTMVNIMVIVTYYYRSSANSAHTIYANDFNLKIIYVFDAIYLILRIRFVCKYKTDN